MSTFDASTLIRDVAEEFIEGLNQDGMGSITDALATDREEAAITGRQPFRASSDTVPHSQGGGHAIGSDVRKQPHALTFIDWAMLQFDSAFDLTTQEIEDLANTMKTSPVEALLTTHRQIVNVDLDLALQTLLAAETNTTAVANGAWDTAGSTPTEDLQTGIQRNLGGVADIALVGLNTAFDLTRHTEFKEQTSFYADGGTMGIDGGFRALRTKLQEITGIPANNIIIGNNFYNAALPGQGLTAPLTYIFGDFFWAGMKEGLVKVEQSSSGQVTEFERHNQHEIAYMRTADIVRVDDFLGNNWTGVGT